MMLPVLLFLTTFPRDLRAAQSRQPREKDVVSQGSVVIDGATIQYTATAGTLILRNAQQEPVASIFYVAYWKTGVRNSDRRPITFAYNGGPGSSSVWLHMGGIGPRRVEVPSDAKSVSPPPYKLVDNPYSILDKSDVVFIDPVGTGFSHPLGKATDSQFWGVDEDVRSVGQFIHDYITKFHRWNSPKFLLGESYGTFRTAALINYVQDQGMQFNGVILLSSVLNFEASSFQPGNDLPYILFLPSYAAIAWYHHALSPQPPSLRPFLRQVEEFATHAYASALLAGDRLDPQKKEKLAAQLAQCTGLSAAYWQKANLRVNADEFEQELLGARGLATGRLDARYVNFNIDPLSSLRVYQVMQSAIHGAFTAAINNYLGHDLHYVSRRPYVIGNGTAARHWDWKHQSPFRHFGARPGFTDVVPDLRRAMIINPYLQLMVNEGYYDLGTPFFATEYSIAQLELPEALRAHVHIYHYFVGHMLYLNTPSLAEMHRNLDAFIGLAMTHSSASHGGTQATGEPRPRKSGAAVKGHAGIRWRRDASPVVRTRPCDRKTVWFVKEKSSGTRFDLRGWWTLPEAAFLQFNQGGTKPW
ncbi:MAG: S10 family peptidase [Candidatus Acidiferrales bacterium]